MSHYGIIFLILLTSFLISYLFTPLIIIIAKKNQAISKVIKRSVHTKPTPHLGGVALYIAFFVALYTAFFFSTYIRCNFSYKFLGLFLASTVIVVVGVIDDIKNIKPSVKLFWQIIVACIIYIFGFRVSVLTNLLFGGEVFLADYISMAITVVWIVGIINAVNLIDGLDGLAAGIIAIVSCALAAVAFFLGNYLSIFLLLALIGSTLGFLRYNFYPAKIFMGDSGSMFLGLLISSIALIGSQYKSSTAVALLIPITALSIPIYDTFLAIVRRVLKKRSIFKADKKHLHHRLLKIGLNQRQIVLLIYIATFYLCIFSFLFIVIPNKYALVLLVLLALWLFIGVRIIGFVERRSNVHYKKIQKK